MSEPETIRLGQALKLAGVVSTGGEAKYLIQHGHVQVNGEVETRRKRQLHPGDTITVGDQRFVIGLDDSPPPAPDAGP